MRRWRRAAAAAVTAIAVGCGGQQVTVLGPAPAPDGPAGAVVLGPQVAGCLPVDDERDPTPFAHVWLDEPTVQDAFDALDRQLDDLATFIGTYVHYRSASVHVVVGAETPDPVRLQRDLRATVGSSLDIDVIVSCRDADALAAAFDTVGQLFADTPGSKGRAIDPATSRLRVAVDPAAARHAERIAAEVPLAEVLVSE